MSELKIEMPRAVNRLIDMLEEAGYRADAVGGAVRDAILGNYAYDYDITTSATPTKIKSVFRHFKVIETGIKHGTVTVVIDKIPYEITTYRIDGEYNDNRHPKSVSFAKKIEDDLSRRDFTVNAMAYSERHGLTDCFGGVSDIEKKLIRAVGNPMKRFSEDALRMLRAIRFSSTLEFEIEENTSDAIFSLKDNIPTVSYERINTEWRKLLRGENALSVLEKYKTVIYTFLPELAPMKLPEASLWPRMNELEREIVLFALNSDAVGYEDAMRRMRSENIRIRFGKLVLECMAALPAPDKNQIVDYILNYDDDVGLTALRLGTMLGIADPKAYDMAYEAICSDMPRTFKMLKIVGEDILLLGLRGEPVGRLLWEILHIVARGECENEESALIKLAASLVDKYR